MKRHGFFSHTSDYVCFLLTWRKEFFFEGVSPRSKRPADKSNKIENRHPVPRFRKRFIRGASREPGLKREPLSSRMTAAMEAAETTANRIPACRGNDVLLFIRG
jgi:hypothetical protein